MEENSYEHAFLAVPCPVMIIWINQSYFQLASANPAFFERFELKLGDLHSGGDILHQLLHAKSESQAGGILNSEEIFKLEDFLLNCKTVIENGGALLVRHITIKDITFIACSCSGTDKFSTNNAELQIDQRKSRDLALFFNNSIFGAFFMEADKPVPWNNSVDQEAALEYLLRHLRITRINQAMLDQYNARREDFIGRTPHDFFLHDMDQERRLLRDIFVKGKHRAVSFERNEAGEEVIFEGDYVVLYNELGEITGIFGLQQDITQRYKYVKRIESQNEKFAQIAWLQSHVVRAPLTRIMSLVELLHKELADDKSTKGLIERLRESSHELDDVISRVVKRAEDVSPASLQGEN